MKSKEKAFWERVEKTDHCWNWLGGHTVTRHARFSYRGAGEYAYRYSYEIHRGTIPEGKSIDHLCHNPSCVKPEHLRIASHQENMANRKGAHKNSKSGVRGVYWHKAKKKWLAQIAVEGKRIHLGYFSQLDKAEAAAVAARKKHYSIPDIGQAV